MVTRPRPSEPRFAADTRPGPAGAPPGGGSRRPPSGSWRDTLRAFVRKHGWRAYALPILVVVTVIALVTTGSSHHTGATKQRPSSDTAPRNTTPDAPSSTSVKVDPGNNAEALPGDALPPGPAYSQRGKGTFHIVKGTSPKVGTGQLITYAIEVEDGISDVDVNQFASSVVSTLSDRRSWTSAGTVALQRVDSANADVRVALTSSMTIRQICGYAQKIETSCRDEWQGVNLVALNVARWVRGDVQFGQDLATYRLYMVNHEFGHSLGHNHSFTCLPNGMAPVMMQQTITLKEDQGKGKKVCMPNAWPYPPGVAKKAAVTT